MTVPPGSDLPVLRAAHPSANGSVDARPVNGVQPFDLDQSQAPYFEALRRYAAVPRAAFHTPGHIQGKGAHADFIDAFGAGALSLDLSPGLGNLDGMRGSALEHAEALAADAYGADRTWFLVNGSSAGNQIMVIAVCRPGDVILTSRNTHKSIIAALVFAGARPVYLAPELDPGSHLAHGVTPTTVAEGIRRHPEARAVLIVSPTYYGACSDVAGIADVAHAHDIPLLVDEAWGPHFPFHPALPAHSLAAGADAVVTGAHKLLGAFLQASMLHVRGPRIDHDRVDVISKMVLSTSPSSMLRASLDIARKQMATQGCALLGRVIELAEAARKTIGAHGRLSCLGAGLVGHHGVTAYDPTRLCVNVSATGHTGYEVERLLAAEGVTVELSDFANVLANITIGHCGADLDRFTTVISAIADRLPAAGLDPRGFVDFALAELPEQVLSPAEAFHAPQERVRLADAADRVSAELAATYPPGIPVVVPGERLTSALVGHLAAQVTAGCRIVGPQDPRLETIRVVCR